VGPKMYRGVVTAERFNHHCIRAGSDVVLNWSRLAHNPLIPFDYAGWAITLQLSPGAFFPGADFVLPTPSVVATLWDIGHLPRKPVSDIRGKIRINAVADSFAEVSMDLASPFKGWVGKDTASFHVRIPHPEWCIDA
jgi:hypothetical protein